jgi:hypothetical protein
MHSRKSSLEGLAFACSVDAFTPSSVLSSGDYPFHWNFAIHNKQNKPEMCHISLINLNLFQ